MQDEEPSVDYYFSFISLWSYVGSLAFQDLVRRRRIRVQPKPMNLMAVFAESGGKPVKDRSAQRQAYRLVEMRRWREIRGIPLVLQPRFYPADPARGHRMVFAALEEGADVAAFIHAGLKAVWADELDIADPDTLVALADRSGLDGSRLLRLSDEERFAGLEAEQTHQALSRGVFGAPFYYYHNEPFWGQDRLDMLEAAIQSHRAPVHAPA